MQILVVTSTYPSPIRPRQGAFNRVMVDALRRNHRVAVISPMPWTQLSWRQMVMGQAAREAEFASKDQDAFFPVSYYPPKILRSLYHQFYWRSMRSCLSRLPSDFRPDVVLGYWLHPDGDAAVRSARHFDVPAVVMSGGTDLKILTQNATRRKAITGVINAADRLVVLSRELACRAESLEVEPSKIDVVFRGVDRDCFTPGDQAEARWKCGLAADEVVLLWAGRLETVKNPMMVLRAAVRWKQHWDAGFRLLIVGDGSLRNKLEAACAEFGLGGCVRFEKSLSQDELAIRYRAANATVLTSHSEGTPNVLLESIACGTPFVATDVGGVGDIATSGIDCLVADDDADGLARSTIEMVGRGILVREREFFPNDLDGMVGQLEEVFGRAMNSSGGQQCGPNRVAIDEGPGPVARRRAS
ncbi:glycosyltransferase [Neorhodopirellula lusitana]|uniref:glycosyltransferase n=1 Tax=Neorhodopirellula lusitana TaxID=445327 RepID=UPI00384E1DCB